MTTQNVKAASLLALLALVSCSKPSGNWVATDDVEVYVAADESNKLKFVVRSGEECSLGRDVYTKMFMYREISCAGRTGWIQYSGKYSDGFAFIAKR